MKVALSIKTSIRLLSPRFFCEQAGGIARCSVAAITTPCSVKACGSFRRPPQLDLDVAKCDFKSANSDRVSRNAKSSGKRSLLRRTCSLSRRVVTPYSSAKSESSLTHKNKTLCNVHVGSRPDFRSFNEMTFGGQSPSREVVENKEKLYELVRENYVLESITSRKLLLQAGEPVDEDGDWCGAATLSRAALHD